MNAEMNFGPERAVLEGLARGRAHLSEAEMDDQLVGDLNVSAAAHLAACELCTQRVATASEPMASFREMTIAWSERRSATMPMPAAPAQGFMQRRMGWAMATGMLAVGIAITGAKQGAGTLGVGMFTAPSTTAQTTEAADSLAAVPVRRVAVSAPVATEAADRSAESRVSADNRMLKAIDNELDASVESPAALGLEPASDNQPHQRTNPVSLED